MRGTSPSAQAAHDRQPAHPASTPSQHTQPVAPNLLGRDFTAQAPNRTWVADITAVATRGGWLYLAGILDVYARRAIGYAMDGHWDERLVETALDMALVSRRPAAGLLHHSGTTRAPLGHHSGIIRIAAASPAVPGIGVS